MPDEFGPQIEADAYRITLWMADAPDESACKTILRVGDDASVSFAKHWLHECQPNTGFWYLTYDCWLVEKFYSDHIYRPIATGVAEYECRRRNESDRSFRRRLAVKAGASTIRNGVGAIYDQITQPRPKRGSGMAPRKRGTRRPTFAQETYAQKRIREMKEEARARIQGRG